MIDDGRALSTQTRTRERIRNAYRRRDGRTSARGHEHLESGESFPNRSREEARRRRQTERAAHPLMKLRVPVWRPAPSRVADREALAQSFAAIRAEFLDRGMVPQ